MQRPNTPKELATMKSDHAPQVDVKSHMVSQNLQAPYAIKKNKDGYWIFDLPIPCRIDAANQGRVLNYLKEYTGMKEDDCIKLCDALIKDNANKAAKDYKESTLELMATFRNVYRGMGDAVGEGGFRISIETHDQYRKRLREQIGSLIDCIQGGAEVLCFQEQPYLSSGQENQERLTILKEEMQKLGYVEKANLPKRDVGIWVREVNQSHYKSITDKSLLSLVGGLPFRGCLLQRSGVVYVNLHAYTRDMEHHRGAWKEVFIQQLCALSKALQDYAKKHNAQLVLCGDLNLFLFTDNEVNKLKEAKFTYELVKGQSKDYPTKCFEAFILAENTVPRILPKEENQMQAMGILVNIIFPNKDVPGKFKKMYDFIKNNPDKKFPMLFAELKAIAQEKSNGFFISKGNSSNRHPIFEALKEMDIENPDIHLLNEKLSGAKVQEITALRPK